MSSSITILLVKRRSIIKLFQSCRGMRGLGGVKSTCQYNFIQLFALRSVKKRRRIKDLENSGWPGNIRLTKLYIPCFKYNLYTMPSVCTRAIWRCIKPLPIRVPYTYHFVATNNRLRKQGKVSFMLQHLVLL